MTSRRISVFTRQDGNTILDRPCDAVPKSSVEQPNPPADTLWPLIQVFVQFSREVQGGTVRRLVFRSPAEYSPQPHTFQPTRVPQIPRNPTVAHVAHDDHFVVVVTEINPKVRLMHDADGVDAAIARLCGRVLHHLNKQNPPYLASLHHPQIQRDEQRPTSASGHTATGTADSEESSIEVKDSPVEDHQNGNSSKKLTSADEAKLVDFITRTQELLQI